MYIYIYLYKYVYIYIYIYAHIYMFYIYIYDICIYTPNKIVICPLSIMDHLCVALMDHPWWIHAQYLSYIIIVCTVCT